MACQGDHYARSERLIREIMVVDQVHRACRCCGQSVCACSRGIVRACETERVSQHSLRFPAREAEQRARLRAHGGHTPAAAGVVHSLRADRHLSGATFRALGTMRKRSSRRWTTSTRNTLGWPHSHTRARLDGCARALERSRVSAPLVRAIEGWMDRSRPDYLFCAGRSPVGRHRRRDHLWLRLHPDDLPLRNRPVVQRAVRSAVPNCRPCCNGLCWNGLYYVGKGCTVR
jgi:hypothetical protein